MTNESKNIYKAYVDVRLELNGKIIYEANSNQNYRFKTITGDEGTEYLSAFLKLDFNKIKPSLGKLERIISEIKYLYFDIYHYRDTTLIRLSKEEPPKFEAMQYIMAFGKPEKIEEIEKDLVEKIKEAEIK